MHRKLFTKCASGWLINFGIFEFNKLNYPYVGANVRADDNAAAVGTDSDIDTSTIRPDSRTSELSFPMCLQA